MKASTLSSSDRTTRIRRVPISARASSPAPAAMPIAATDHSEAAVVSPLMLPRCWRMVPAPMKPMPETICAAILVGSTTDPAKP